MYFTPSRMNLRWRIQQARTAALVRGALTKHRAGSDAFLLRNNPTILLVRRGIEYFTPDVEQLIPLRYHVGYNNHFQSIDTARNRSFTQEFDRKRPYLVSQRLGVCKTNAAPMAPLAYHLSRIGHTTNISRLHIPYSLSRRSVLPYIVVNTFR